MRKTREAFEVAAKKYFGLTNRLEETGYILSDGSMLDLSGRHAMSSYVWKNDRYVPKRGPDFMYGRSIDHRELPPVVLEALGKDYSEGMLAFLEITGALRVMPPVGFAVVTMPTVEAVSSFARGWRLAYRDDEAIVEVIDVTQHTRDSETIQAPTTEKIMDFLESSFERKHNLGSMKFRKGPKDWSPSGRIPGMPIWPEFVDGYLEAALFSSTDNSDESGGRPLDEKFTVKDFDQASVNRAVKDCNSFIEENRKDLDTLKDIWAAGKDFWFTRGGHGVGYWDGDYEEELGERLTESAHKYGERHVDVEGSKLHIYG